MKRIAAILISAGLLAGCSPRSEKSVESLKTGSWRATLEIQNLSLPFNFEVVKDQTDQYDILIRNAEERLRLDEVTTTADSVNITLHIFDANIKARINGDTLEGVFVKNYEKDSEVPFRAVYGQNYRFEKAAKQDSVTDFSGRYAVTFLHEADTTLAVGIFKQTGDNVTGTFLTPTGDYRYLEGNVVNGTLQLSTFDGNHAYIFTATKQNQNLTGHFYSGKAWHETWTGTKDDNATLPDPESLTFLKPGIERMDIAFPDVNGKTVRLTDEKYKNKVVILQLFGTWCPNCMDETQFLSPWFNDNQRRGVEIIGLAFERKDDFEYASSRVKKMIEKFGVKYDFVIAGTNDKADASAKLPMLNRVVAFPTTIFIGKDGKVKKIHTGFSGPGTGLYYDQFVQHFNETVNELLSENLTSLK